MKETIDTLTNLVDRGLLVSSEDFAVEKLPDGRSKVRLLKKLKAARGRCFTANSLLVTFSGILTNCGCVVTAPGTSFNVSSSSVSGAYTVPFLAAVPGMVIYDLPLSGVISGNRDNGSQACAPGLPATKADITVVCSTTRACPAGVSIYLAATTDDNSSAWMFYALVPLGGSLVNVPNQITCGQLVNDGGCSSPHLYAVAHGGTATVVEL